jgi:Zn-dependent protease
MFGSVSFGRLRGFSVRLDYGFFPLLALVLWVLSTVVFPGVYGFAGQAGWLLGSAATVLVFAGIVAHELAHLEAARRLGLSAEGLTLFLLGGAAHIEDEPRSPGAELVVAGAGPLASFLLALAALGLCGAAERAGLAAAAAVLHYTSVLNLTLAVFNLAPGLPLDGGRLLRAVLWQWTGSRAAGTAWASLAGQGLGAALAVYGVFQFLAAGQPAGVATALLGGFLVSCARDARPAAQALGSGAVASGSARPSGCAAG